MNWQVMPRVPAEALAAGDDVVELAFEALMTTRKSDVADIEVARGVVRFRRVDGVP